MIESPFDMPSNASVYVELELTSHSAASDVIKIVNIAASRITLSGLTWSIHETNRICFVERLRSKMCFLFLRLFKLIFSGPAAYIVRNTTDLLGSRALKGPSRSGPAHSELRHQQTRACAVQAE